MCPGQGYSKSARQLSGSFAARLTESLAVLDSKEAPTMLQIALDPIEIAPPCRTCHQKVNAQILPCPGQGYSKSERQLWCCTTYVSVDLVASEVGQCDMQSPAVVDRSALAAVHGGS